MYTWSQLEMPVQTLAVAEEQAMASENMEDVNGIKLEFDQMDNKIIAATLKAFESGSLTPLIKEELRCTIQSRRLAEGKGEMKVEFKTPVKRKEMTDEERKRALKRRQQNREAAQRFRQKQKDTSDYLSAKIKRLESSSKTLIDDMKRLKEERELLRQMLENHLLVCTNPVAPKSFPCPHNVNITDSQGYSTTSFTSSASSITDYQSVTDTPSIPDTAASDSSVFFADDDAKFVNLEPAVLVPTFGCNESVPEIQVYDGQYLDVGYEETVVNVDDTDSEFDEERRPDSCSSSEALVCKAEACSADWSCLSESMRSVTSAYSRAHLESCSSQNFEPLAEEDLFLLEEMTS